MKEINSINNVIKSIIVVCTLILSMSMDGVSQERAQADVSITSVTITPMRSRPTLVREFGTTVTQPGASQPGAKVLAAPETLKCSITVHSHWDDDANQAMLVVVVPVEVSIVSHPPNATVYKAGGTSKFAGYLVFSLGDMAVNQSITVEFTFTRSAYGNKVGAYAYSASPDPNPANNYKDATY